MISNVDIVEVPESGVVRKGWGQEHTLNNKEYCCKVLTFIMGGKTSLHHHADKIETFYIANGTFMLTLIDPMSAKKFKRKLFVGQFQNVPRGHAHRLECVSEGGGAVVEASTLDCTWDSYRLEPGDSQV